MKSKVWLAMLSCLMLVVGQIGGPILTRLYFLHGGNMKWLGCLLVSGGFPILIIPIAISYSIKRRTSATARVLITRWLFGSGVFIGFAVGFSNYLYNFGTSYLPISVLSILSSSTLAFCAVSGFLVVKQKFTHYSINAVVLMTMGSIVMGLHMDNDRPDGESHGKYSLGFFMTIVAAALHGFILTATEYIHMKSGVPITYDLLMQFQFLQSMFATLFCTVPMLINKDFQAIPKEAKEFSLGETKYYTILVVATIVFQLTILGTFWLIIFYTSLLVGIVYSLVFPLQQLFAVIFLPETFNEEKGVSLALCLWGFTSYFYGEYKKTLKKKPPQEKQQPVLLPDAELLQEINV